MSIHDKLVFIQKSLSVPKNQRNDFGGFNYRSCEDILEAVKSLLGDCTIIVSDEMQEVGGRVYVKAIATLSDGEKSVSAQGFAREAISRKGMDDSQITGATSSYARKYALNGLFLIDDNKDADTQAAPERDWTTEINSSMTKGELTALWSQMNAAQHKQYEDLIKKRASEVEAEQ